MKTPRKAERRTVADLDRALRSLAAHFDEDIFVIVGSQGVLVGWDSTPDAMRNTPEIDIFLPRWAEWQARNPEAETPDFEIEGLFGRGSQFSQTHGFHIDGVSPDTATLPTGWERRAVYREIRDNQRVILAVAPCVEDLAISKMRRLEEKDRLWIEACNEVRGLDKSLMKSGLTAAAFEDWERNRALAYLDTLVDHPPLSHREVEAPDYPPETHEAFWSKAGREVVIRKRDPVTGLFINRDNPAGPALRTASLDGYYIEGMLVSETTWRVHHSGDA